MTETSINVLYDEINELKKENKELNERIEILEAPIKEKQKEEEIKKIIMDIIAHTPLDVKDSERGRVFCSNRVVDKIYDELKEKDLIK